MNNRGNKLNRKQLYFGKELNTYGVLRSHVQCEQIFKALDDIMYILPIAIDALKGAQIKYLGEGRQRVSQIFFKKKFVVQETKDLNISWPRKFFRKILHGLTQQF